MYCPRVTCLFGEIIQGGHGFNKTQPKVSPKNLKKWFSKKFKKNKCFISEFRETSHSKELLPGAVPVQKYTIINKIKYFNNNYLLTK